MKNLTRILLSSSDGDRSEKIRLDFCELCEHKGFQIVEEDPDLVVSIGGDGTMLRAIREYKKLGVSFVGINAGRLGFLPNFKSDAASLNTLLDMLKNGNYRIIHRPVLDVDTRDEDGGHYKNDAFNEVVVKFSNFKMMDIGIDISGRHFNDFTGDGIVISTPLGTTGYAIWAGAAALNPELECYQLTPINPNNASIRNPLLYPLVLPERESITLHIKNREKTPVVVSMDGNSYESRLFSRIDVRISDEKVGVIESNDYDYWSIFKDKLLDKNL